MQLKSESIEGVVNLYLTTPEFTRKIQSNKTRTQYGYQLSRLCALKDVGSLPLDKLTVAQCQKIYWQLYKSMECSNAI